MSRESNEETLAELDRQIRDAKPYRSEEPNVGCFSSAPADWMRVMATVRALEAAQRELATITVSGPRVSKPAPALILQTRQSFELVTVDPEGLKAEFRASGFAQTFEQAPLRIPKTIGPAEVEDAILNALAAVDGSSSWTVRGAGSWRVWFGRNSGPRLPACWEVAGD